jgi:hypothetical protein
MTPLPPATEYSPEAFDDLECEFACELGAGLPVDRQLMRSWIGSIAAAMPDWRIGARIERLGGNRTIAAMQARIDELVRENLTLRAELIRRAKGDTGFRRSKRTQESMARRHGEFHAPGHDIAILRQPTQEPRSVRPKGPKAVPRLA